jgi:protein-S-isoprenylcysteine O-methyltransferase Ste14
VTNPVRFLMRVPVPWVFVLTYLLGAGLGASLKSARFASILRGPPVIGLTSTIAGYVLLIVGAVIAVWCQIIFRAAQTTTVPGKSSVKLVTRGPYAFTRNPMYLGLILIYLGEAGLLKQVGPVVTLPFMVGYLNWTVIPVEEMKLKEVFQGEYENYRSKVRRWI